MSEKEPSRWRPRAAWLAIIGFVVAYDALCPPGATLSEEVYRMRQSKLGRVVVDRLIDDVAGHLKQTIDPEDDWIHKIAEKRPKGRPKLDGSDRFDVFGTDDE